MEWYRDRFKDKTVLVTGTSSGIGRATTIRLLAEGATVIGADIGEPPELDPLGASDGRFLFVHTDVRDDDAATEAVSAAVEVGGRLDGLVHAAATAGSTIIHLLEREAWDRVVTTNLTGTYVVAKAALAQMLGQEPIDGERGSIVTMAAIAGLQGQAGGSSFSAAAGGITLFTRTLAVEYGASGIRANVISPGIIDTPMSDAAFDGPGLHALAKSYKAAHPLGRFGDADEVAATALFLLTPDASFISGANIAVDGGYTAGRDHGMTQLFDLMRVD
jgi:NAD(P)-dependent dehydrogenase (short-subunit alcohol dehydrogenase family)